MQIMCEQFFMERTCGGDCPLKDQCPFAKSYMKETDIYFEPNFVEEDFENECGERSEDL